MYSQRDYAEERANRAAMEQEGREEYAAEQAERTPTWRELMHDARREEYAARQRTKPLAVRLAEFCEVDQARFLSLIHDAYDVAGVMHQTTFTRGQLLDMLTLVLGNAENGTNAFGSAPYELHPLVTL
jgi:hypothetical protein